ncbi:MAG: DNA helicase RecQ [Pirellulales bacterium]
MSADDPRLLEVLQKHWGYNELRPLQRESMGAVLAGRDSVVVLATGGGKSLCYQAPALLLPGMAVVVSPLISLMKDQVDALNECGVPAAAVHSALEPDERQRIAEEIRGNRLKLLYVAPERLANRRMIDYLRERTISFFAIDEAHCISNWGHEFRPDYRLLGTLREHFPQVAVHGFTATATQQVRDDIAAQLRLRQPEVLVGGFDRPNLHYRVARRHNLGEQIHAVLSRHLGEAGIIYCISRKEVDALAAALRLAGVKAAPYHAGLSDQERRDNQEAFLNEQVDVVVATVAFGMGIDKSNVRFVIHAAAPKSLEHYQQETGRAGRDGLEAECCLFYGGNDFVVWRKLASDLPDEARGQSDANLQVMESYCSSVLCKHKALAEHFGQAFEATNCQACDACLDQQDCLPDALVVSQKILSCVLRVNENFGGDYVAQVLAGSQDQRVLENRHDRLSTHGLLKEHGKAAVREWIEQLCGQGFLLREGEYRLLKVTTSGREVLRGEQSPKLLRPRGPKSKRSAAARPARDFSVGMDAGLFESLRILRRKLAEGRGVPPFVIFGDATLQDLSRRRPSTAEGFRQAHGVGEHKSQQYAEVFLAEIGRYCAEHGICHDAEVADSVAVSPGIQPIVTAGKSATKSAAEEMFRAGNSLEDVARRTGRARSTVTEYLADFLRNEGRTSPEPWVEMADYQAIIAAAEAVGVERMKPIFEHLNGQMTYDQIRLALACYRP